MVEYGKEIPCRIFFAFLQVEEGICVSFHFFAYYVKHNNCASHSETMSNIVLMSVIHNTYVRRNRRMFKK